MLRALASLAVSLPLLAAAPAAYSQVTELWAGPAHSGSWYSPERSGEGFTLQILDNGLALALWFTYPPEGVIGQQAWIYAAGGRVDGDRVRFDNAITTRGPRFGPTYDPAHFQTLPWGSFEFRFTGCNTAQLTYQGPQAWGFGSRALERLTALSELECSGKRHVTARGARSFAGLQQRGGSWFDPAHNGEGWTLEELPDGRALVYWFTYDGNGNQAWTVGVSQTSGARVVVEENLRPVGTRFGNAFDPARVNRTHWGRLEIDFADCNRATLRYASTNAEFGSGTLAPVRLTRLSSTVCLDAMPSAPAGGTWSSGAPMPNPASEFALASLGGRAYVAGGFGDEQGFKRYDPATSQWTVLPQVPGGRDHAVSAAFENDVFVTGGNPQGGGNQFTTGWRFNVAENRWIDAPQLPRAVASGGAELGGFLYFATTSGFLFQYNPRTQALRFMSGDGRAPRDHSQLVAFQGELWLLGGRGPTGETALTSIWDPVAETWRPGPALQTARAGFAAASSDTLILVAGGESLAGTFRTLSSVEAIAAGSDAWIATLPRLPTAMHGFGGVLHGNSFHALGGSTLAGGASNPGTVQILRW